MRSQWPRHAGWTALALLVGCDGGARDIAAAVERSRVLVRNARHAEAIQVLEARHRKTGGDARTLVMLVRAYLERSPNFYGSRPRSRRSSWSR